MLPFMDKDEEEGEYFKSEYIGNSVLSFEGPMMGDDEEDEQ